MLWMQSCPRCQNGDMYLDQDDCKHCMQCGYVANTTNPAAELALQWFEVINGHDMSVKADSLDRLAALVSVS